MQKRSIAVDLFLIISIRKKFTQLIAQSARLMKVARVSHIG